MSKNILFLAAFLLLISSCKKKGNKDECIITGKIENYKNSALLLTEVTPLKAFKIKEIEVSENGNFEVIIPSSEKSIYCINLRNQFFIYLINDSPEIEIETNYNEFENYIIKGSSESSQLQQLINRHKRYATEEYLAKELLYQNIASNKGKFLKNEETKTLEKKVDLATIELKTFVKNYMDTTLNKLIAVAASNLLSIEEDYDYLVNFSSVISKTNINPKQKEKLNEKVDQVKNFNNSIPPLTNVSGLNTDKKTISIPDLKGKYVFINTGATWCYYSIHQYAYFVTAYNKFRNNENIVFINVSIDNDTQDWLNFIQSDTTKVPYNICDPKEWQADVLKHFQVKYIPANFLLDKNGKIITKNMRNEEMIKAIQKVLSEKTE